MSTSRPSSRQEQSTADRVAAPDTMASRSEAMVVLDAAVRLENG
jgi:hypothetical protein